jgi:GNAT superfamily N-acetyltransferase
VRIRSATVHDAPLLASLVRELADYERAPDAAVGTAEDFERHLFGERPAAEALIAEVDGGPAGFALFFTTFSTWLARPGIWLEDLFVRPDHRRAGIGRALLEHLAGVAVERGCGRMEWVALDWNEAALSFYGSLGAEVVGGWKTLRLHGEALQRLGGG